MLTQLKTLFTDYNAAVQEVRKKARAFDGILGLGKDPRKDPCHEQFYNAVGKWTEDFLATEPSQEDLKAAALFLVEEPKNYEGIAISAPAARAIMNEWLNAGWVDIKPMIGTMCPETSQMIKASLEAAYKKRDRMPLQKELLKLLDKK